MSDNKVNEDELYFNIKEVSRQIGVVPATIRNWEKQGIFTPKRTEKGYRIFSMSDIEHLRRIRQYSKDEHIGISAIRKFYSEPVEHSVSKTPKTIVSKKLLSQKWKKYRIQKGYLLEDVAKEVGISASYLSKIENSQANVSYELLERIALFYGQNILYYVDEPEEENMLVRKDTGETFSIGIKGVSVQSLISLKQSAMSSMLYTVEPGCGRFQGYSHTGEEFLYILFGRIRIKINEQEYVLKSGDSFSFRSKDFHSWHNCGKVVAKMVWVYTALTIE